MTYEPTTIAGAKAPRVRVARKRVGRRSWFWYCDTCRFGASTGHPSQPAALQDACRHLDEGCPR